MRFVTCLGPDGVEEPAVLSADGTAVTPLRWLGLPCDTLTEAIPQLTPAVRAGLALALSAIPSVPDGGFIEAHTDLVKKLDYECELAVVLGRDAKDVPAGQTRDYVFGYTILNDVSARDVQTAHKQWYFGKSLDGFTPIGPCIVTADEFEAYPPQLGIRSFVNGEKRQDSNTRLQIFDIDHVIHELSQGMTLKAGTIIATGTPAGVGMGMDPPQFLQPGDTVRCEIDGIGSLTNTVR